jgi:hypothetical protein
LPIEFELSQLIRQPVEKVFSFLSDFSNMPLWNYYIQRVSKISEGDIKVGSLFEMKRPHDLTIYKIIELKDSGSIVVQLQPPGPDQKIIFTLNQDGEDTRVRYKWILELEKYKVFKYIPHSIVKRWLLSIPEKIILTKTKPAVDQNFRKLKELLESGKTILPDGRQIVLGNSIL